jgi:5-methylcytosine-specific restriction protein A
MFEIGRIYNRRREIHAKYGGQEQGGIATPSGKPFIFLFTAEAGADYGYKDGWNKEGVFLYTGEGQTGDMEFVRGNRAIRDHIENGKALHLFKSLGKGKDYEYIGRFVSHSWEIRQGLDVNKQSRQTIVFNLVQTE